MSIQRGVCSESYLEKIGEAYMSFLTDLGKHDKSEFELPQLFAPDCVRTVNKITLAERGEFQKHLKMIKKVFRKWIITKENIRYYPCVSKRAITINYVFEHHVSKLVIAILHVNENDLIDKIYEVSHELDD